jgi:hypothetical protein
MPEESRIIGGQNRPKSWVGVLNLRVPGMTVWIVRERTLVFRRLFDMVDYYEFNWSLLWLKFQSKSSEDHK